jgi:hypothetical protein
MRKATQITVTPNGYYATVCDDGTMWELDGKEWQQLAPIPQDAKSQKSLLDLFFLKKEDVGIYEAQDLIIELQKHLADLNK